MRALHVYSGNLYGGVETLLVTLARESPRDSSVQHLFALCFEGRLSRELRDAGATPMMLGEVRLRAPASALRARRHLAAALSDVRPDVVVCHSAWTHGIFAGVARRARLPLVFYLHDAMSGRSLVEQLAKRVPPDLVLCNSEHTRSTVSRVYERTVSTRAVHLPVAPPPEELRDGRERIRAKFGVSPRDCVIVQACRMQAWKGHRLLLAALARLDARLTSLASTTSPTAAPPPRFVAWIAGGAQRPEEVRYEEALRDEARALGLGDRVLFLGQRSDVPALLAAADIHCQPNASPEPFGIALVEALYAGLPVVTTAMGGALEIVTPESGALVPRRAAAVEEALARFVLDPALRARAGAAARARARELCDPTARMADLARAFVDARAFAGSRAARPGGVS